MTAAVDQLRSLLHVADEYRSSQVMLDTELLRELLGLLDGPTPGSPGLPEPFISHAFTPFGTHRLCGASGGRTTVRAEAVECPACLLELRNL